MRTITTTHVYEINESYLVVADTAQEAVDLYNRYMVEIQGYERRIESIQIIGDKDVSYDALIQKDE